MLPNQELSKVHRKVTHHFDRESRDGAMDDRIIDLPRCSDALLAL